MNYREFCDKTAALALDPEFRRVLEKHGFKPSHPTKYVGGSFREDGHITLKVGVSDASPEGRKAVEERDAVAFKIYAESVGLKKEHFGKVITVKNKRLTITGFNPGKPKFCIATVEPRTGKHYNCPADTVRRALERSGEF